MSFSFFSFAGAFNDTETIGSLVQHCMVKSVKGIFDPSSLERQAMNISSTGTIMLQIGLSSYAIQQC